MNSIPPKKAPKASPEAPRKSERSEFLGALAKGVLIGAAVLLIVLPSITSRTPGPLDLRQPPSQQAPSQAPSQATAPAQPSVAPPVAPVRVADFKDHQPTQDARLMANCVLQANDNQKLSFVIVAKKDARVYVFDSAGRMKSTTPALLGSAVGDDSFPGIGDKPLSQVKPEEKTTPAGRFVAELGMNTNGEDIVWVDYDAAVSMHRVRALVAAERRLERLASPTPEDNRISFGCINLPRAFYEDVLKPTVQAGRTIIYVLPETRPLREVFASFQEGPTAALKVAQRQ